MSCNLNSESHRTFDDQTNTCDCDDGYFDDGTSENCIPCDASCLTCTNSAENCTSCSTSAHRVSSGTTCICASGYYNNNGNCDACDITCKTCTGSNSNNCSTCNTNAYRTLVNSNTCACTNNYFDDHVHELCQSCHSSCLTCSDENFDSCDSCDSSLNRVLQGYVCKCKDGFFENSQGVCEACSSTC